jgi:transporter family protein
MLFAICHMLCYNFLMWLIFAILSAISAACVAIFGKLGLKGIDATLGTAIRGTVMAVLLILLVLVLKKVDIAALRGISGKEWMFLVLAGVAGALSWLAYFYALQKGPASAVAAIDRTSVVFVLLFAGLFLAEAITWKTALGAVLIAGGALLFVF